MNLLYVSLDIGSFFGIYPSTSLSCCKSNSICACLSDSDRIFLLKECERLLPNLTKSIFLMLSLFCGLALESFLGGSVYCWFPSLKNSSCGFLSSLVFVGVLNLLTCLQFETCLSCKTSSTIFSTLRRIFDFFGLGFMRLLDRKELLLLKVWKDADDWG